MWDVARWDGGSAAGRRAQHRLGIDRRLGFSHAPVVQVTMAQQAKPEVELISIAGTFERLAITV